MPKKPIMFERHVFRLTGHKLGSFERFVRLLLVSLFISIRCHCRAWFWLWSRSVVVGERLNRQMGHNARNITKGCRFNRNDILLAIELFYWKATWAGLTGGDFTNWQISDVVSWNKPATLKVGENFRMACSINILDGALVDIPWNSLKHVQQRMQFFSIVIPGNFTISSLSKSKTF